MLERLGKIVLDVLFQILLFVKIVLYGPLPLLRTSC